MKALVAATLVLVIAVADFVVRGRGFLAQEQAALAALDERIDRVTTMQREMPVVSRAEHDEASREREHWERRIAARLARLTDPDMSLVVPTLTTQWDATRIPGLQPGDPPRETIERQAAESALVEAVFARVLDTIQRAGIAQVDELTLLGAGRPEAVAGAAGLSSVDLQLVVHGDLASVFSCLEALVPGATLPALGVRSATVQRVVRERWVTLPLDRMSGPPVRLTATVTALYPGGDDREDG